jgi:hypothetical protein
MWQSLQYQAPLAHWLPLPSMVLSIILEVPQQKSFSQITQKFKNK